MASSRKVIESVPLYQKALQSLSEGKQSSGGLPGPSPEISGSDSLPNFPSSFPSVKRIPGTQFVVDGFRSAGPWSVSYFLSHFHSDHYTGLTNVWTSGLVICSEITAHLVTDSLQVPDELVVSLSMGQTHVVDGCEVTLVDANHCPGAVQFLFRVPAESGEWQRYVHCGDMRFSPEMKSIAPLCDFVGADAVFLDTTYCNPKYVFPPQQTSVDYVADTVHRLMEQDKQGVLVVEGSRTGDKSTLEVQDGSDGEDDPEGRQEADSADEMSKSVAENVEDDDPDYDRRLVNGGDSHLQALEGTSTLFLIATYVIGKEKILTAVAKRCNCSIYVSERKLKVLKRLDMEDIDVFTTDPAATNVHVVSWRILGETWPYFRPNFVNMEKAMNLSEYQKVVGFVPTGWTYDLKKKTFLVRKKGPFEIHLVPYSEHSNYDELREYVGFLRPREIIPTVGLDGGGMESKAVATMRKHFRNLVDETASKRNFLKGFSRKSTEEPTGFASPKAIFGSGARKRRRETNDSFTDEYVECSHFPPEDQQILKKSKDMIESEMSPGLFSDGLGNHSRETEISVMELSVDFLEDASRSKVSTSLGAGLTEGAGPCQSPYKKLAGQEPPTPRTGPPLQVVSSQTARSQSENILSSQKPSSGVGDRLQSKRRVTTKNSSAVKRKPKSSSSRLPLKKLGTRSQPGAASQFSGSQKGVQSSILNFFKKPVGDLTLTESAPVDSLKQDLTLKANTGLLKQVGWEPIGDDDGKVSNPDLIQVQMDPNKWADEYEQLASILDESISEKQVHFFLEKAGGNVGIALDLFYMDQQVSKLSAQSNAAVEPQSRNTTESQSIQGAECREILGDLNSVDSITEPGSEGKVQEKEASHEQLELVKWANEHEQLASILEGNLSKEEAYLLLEKGGGDVTRALDIFYTEKSVMEESLPSKNAVSPSHLNKGGASVEYTSHVSRPTGLEDHGRSPHGRQEKGQKAPNPVPDPRGPSASLGTHSDKNTDGLGANNSIHKKGSVSVSAAKYSSIEHACWELGDPAPYLHLARAFDLIEQESGRLKTADMLCNMFRSLLALSPEAVLPAVYLTTNRLGPEFENGELSIGGSLVSTAICEVTGVSRSKLREMYKSMGDLGDMAQACRQTQSSLRLPPLLGICQVFSTLKRICKEAGTGSGARKKELVLSLLRACREKEIKYIVRTLIQNLRIGATMKTVLSVLARAVVLHRSFPPGVVPEKEVAKLKPVFQAASEAVAESYNFLPNLDLIVPALIKDGVEAVSARFIISPGTPIKPMLAKIANGVSELLNRFEGEPFICQYKYDGMRAQIHMLPDGTVRIFTRDSGDATGRFPDVINIVKEAAREDLKTSIIDAEVVAIDRENGNKLLAFQHLSTRERGSRDGTSVNLRNIKVDVAVFVFDIMFANDEPLVKLSLQERLSCMQKWFPNLRPGYFGYASEITVNAEEDSVSVSRRVQEYLEEAFEASCEGLMAKALVKDSSYMASKRSDSWLKIKKDYVDGLQDSLDLVPIGAWYGSGRKAGWYSPFLLACYDPEREEYQSVCRVMSGFTDTFYKEMTEFYSGDHILSQKPLYYRTGEEPSVWFTPELVWEIRGADLTVSPVHQAAVGLIHESRGISMRFPRFIRSRPDKKPGIANGPLDVADLFQKQTRKLEVARS